MPVSVPSVDEDCAKLAGSVRRHMPVLDGLRGVAVAMVVAHNTGSIQRFAPTHWHKILYALHLPWWIGVHLFFVLSGFLITGILLDAKERTRAPELLRGFYIRRTLRIFPLYFAALALGFVVAPMLLPSLVSPTPLSTQVWYWAYLENWVMAYGRMVSYFAHFWSLAVEEQFYLVWPAIVLLASRRTLVAICIALAIAALGLRWGLVMRGASPIAVYQFTVTRMDALTLGALAAVVARAPDVMRRLAPFLRPALVVTGVALLVLVPASHGFPPDQPLSQIPGHSLVAVFFTLVILTATLDEVRGGRGARLLSHPGLRFLGRYSYAIYVVHVPIASRLAPFVMPYVLDPSFRVAAAAMLLNIAAVGVASTGFAVLSWNLLEKRLLALKERLAPRNVPRNERIVHL